MPLNRPLARIACAAGLTAVLTAGGTIAPMGAYAASAETEAELSRLAGEVDAAASTYQEAMAKAAELESEIDALAADILTLEQETLPVQRERAGDAAVELYKMQANSSGVVATLLSAGTFADFTNLAKYLGVIENRNVTELENLNELSAELEKKLEQVSASKDEAVKQQEKAAGALAKAQEAQRGIQAKAAAENAAEAAAARKAAEEAAARLAEAQKQQAGESSTEAQGNKDRDQGAPSESKPETSTPSTPSEPSEPSTPSSGWKSGKASYYGIGDGFMGGTTASGAIVTETSMGVAMLNVPLGTMVEISYRGRSVIAVVNDRGPYVGDRVIDMQPAVARALGFLQVGVDTVQYRFL